MYISNLRTKIIEMDDSTFEDFLEKAFDYHINQLHRQSLRKADFSDQIKEFKTGKTIKMTLNNFDSFLYALDSIYGPNGATDALYGVTKGQSWREVLLKSTSDLSIPKEVEIGQFLDNTRLVKSIIKNILIFCFDGDKDITENNLRLVDGLLKAALSKQS